MISVSESIKAGEFDNVLDQIANAIKLRKQFLTAQLVLSLNVEDRVRLVNISPKYLTGCEGIVKRFTDYRVYVQLVHPPRGRRFGEGGPIGVYKQCVSTVV